MPSSRSRLPLVQRVIEQVGLSGLAEIETELVRHRPVPPRLVAKIVSVSEDVHLTKREREVMVLLVSGYKQTEIAAELGTSIHTVHGQIKSAYAKLGAHSAIEAANAFLEREA